MLRMGYSPKNQQTCAILTIFHISESFTAKWI